MRPRRSVLLCGMFVLALAVTPAWGAAAPPARVVLRAQATPDGTVQVTAKVVDGRGAGVAEVPVVLKARTAFGWLTLRETTTRKDGTAQVTLAPGAVPSEIAVEAGEDGNLTAAIRMGEKTAVAPRIRPGRDVLTRLSPQPGFISPYPVPLQVALLGLILGGIWTIYGYVGWMLVRMAKGVRGRP